MSREQGHTNIVESGEEVRILFRDEGEYYVAYLARKNSTRDMIEISRLRVAMAKEDKVQGSSLIKEMWTVILADWLGREIQRHQLPGEVSLEREDGGIQVVH